MATQASSLAHDSSGSSSDFLQVNKFRALVVIVNEDSGTLYVKEGTSCSNTNHTYKLAQGDTVVIDNYTGIISGIWDSPGSGWAMVTERVYVNNPQ